MSTNTKARVT